MKKLLAVLFIAVFAMTFAVGVLVSTAEAIPPCTATCIDGVLLVCCPVAPGIKECHWGGPCDW